MQFVIAIALLVISYVITQSMIKRPQDAKPSGIGDFDLPVAEEGTPQAVFFGDCWSGDWQVLWYGDFEVQPLYSGGGKK